MFNFTTTLSYGLRLLINLSLNGKGPKQLKKIAKEEGISLLYLRKLTPSLEKAGLIKSLRGPGGGFMLTRAPENVKVVEVINTLSRNKVLDCVKGASGCRRYGGCAVKDLLEEAYTKFQSVFDNKTLATIMKREKK